jgi:predicted alpha/beta superfamily hydrolase
MLMMLLFALAPGTQAAAAPEPVLPHQTLTIDSRVLGETRRINVYTPPGYDDADARYPVLYMPDGGLEEDFPHVISDIDAAIHAGEMRPVLVVGIENTQRRRDMTGPTDVAEDRKIAPRVGGSANFRAFIRDELMPSISRRFRGNGQTAIVGESLAGLFVVETFFQELQLFDTCIALSPSLWWNGQALVHGATEWLRTHPRLNGTLYLAVAGDDDRGDAVKALAAALRAAAPKSLTWYYEPRPDQQHSTIYRAASPGAFRELFPPTTPADLTPRVVGLLRGAGARGAVLVRDVRTGDVVASAGLGRDVTAPVLPLSVIKLYVAAMWWDRELGDGSLEEPGVGRVSVHDVVANGYDRPGKEMAVVLRRKIGAEAMLAGLRRYGLGSPPAALTLAADAGDAAWGDNLSIGEHDITVTLEQVSRFLRAVGLGGQGLLKPETARRLQDAMKDTVARGTARGVAPKLADTRWQLGGKTGTGPYEARPSYDGWFAGLIFENGKPRYTVAVYIDGGGPGGGVAASIAADLTRLLP